MALTSQKLQLCIIVLLCEHTCGHTCGEINSVYKTIYNSQVLGMPVRNCALVCNSIEICATPVNPGTLKKAVLWLFAISSNRGSSNL